MTLWTSPLSLLAQSQAPDQASKGLSAVSALWVPNMAMDGTEIYITPGGNVVPQLLAVGGNGRGKPVMLEVGSTKSLKLMAKATAPTPGGTPWIPLGEVALPTGKSARYLLLLAGKPNVALVRGMAIDDSVEAFPAESVKVANLGSAVLMAKIGTRGGQYGPGFSAAMPYPVTASKDSKDTPSFPCAFALQESVFYNGRIDAWSGSRTLVLVSPSPSGDSPTVKLIVDRPAPQAPVALRR